MTGGYKERFVVTVCSGGLARRRATMSEDRAELLFTVSILLFASGSCLKAH